MKKLALAWLILLAVISSIAEASLVGDIVTIQRADDNFIFSSRSVEVSSGIELYYWNAWLFDISDYDIYMASVMNTGYTATGFNGFIFSDLDFSLNEEIIDSVIVTGLDQNRVSFSDHAISLDFGGLGFTNTQSINIEIGTSTAPVPAPSTIFLLSTGIIGLAGSRMLRKKR
jgi:hypothetical protein